MRADVLMKTILVFEMYFSRGIAVRAILNSEDYMALRERDLIPDTDVMISGNDPEPHTAITFSPDNPYSHCLHNASTIRTSKGKMQKKSMARFSCPVC